MKHILIASLTAAQLSATPAFAASLQDHSTVATSRGGAFAGARLRIGLGGRDHGKARAGLTLAPVSRGERADGVSRLRFAEGLEFGFRGDERARLSIAGQPIGKRRLGVQEDGADDDDGVPTWALVVGGVALAAGIGVVTWYIDAGNDATD